MRMPVRGGPVGVGRTDAAPRGADAAARAGGPPRPVEGHVVGHDHVRGRG